MKGVVLMKKEYTNQTNHYQVIGNTSVVVMEGTEQECKEFLKGTIISDKVEKPEERKNNKPNLCLVAPGETVSRCYGMCCGACDQRASYEEILERWGESAK